MRQNTFLGKLYLAHPCLSFPLPDGEGCVLAARALEPRRLCSPPGGAGEVSHRLCLPPTSWVPEETLFPAALQA